LSWALRTELWLEILLQSSVIPHPRWRLPESSKNSAYRSKLQRRFKGFSDEETFSIPGRYQGKSVLANCHKAKGLKLDQVYLMSVNN
jgi:hypothetical protein